MMRRRVVALVLTLVVAGTPEALTICQVICSSSSAHGDMASHDHSGSASHHSQAPVSDAAVNIAANHDGCHRDRVSPLIAPTPERISDAAILPPVVAILPPQPRVLLRADRPGANQSLSVPPSTPLRI